MPTTLSHTISSDLPSGVPAVWWRDEANDLQVHLRPGLSAELTEHLLTLAAASD